NTRMRASSFICKTPLCVIVLLKSKQATTYAMMLLTQARKEMIYGIIWLMLSIPSPCRCLPRLLMGISTKSFIAGIVLFMILGLSLSPYEVRRKMPLKDHSKLYDFSNIQKRVNESTRLLKYLQVQYLTGPSEKAFSAERICREKLSFLSSTEEAHCGYSYRSCESGCKLFPINLGALFFGGCLKSYGTRPILYGFQLSG
ncbi:hypothetical protein HID58_006486, partial [Brassica napus]